MKAKGKKINLPKQAESLRIRNFKDNGIIMEGFISQDPGRNYRKNSKIA